VRYKSVRRTTVIATTASYRMSSLFVLPEADLRLLDDVILVKYFHVASVAILAYDCLMMLPDEIRYIWKAQWSWGMMLYLLTRYLAFFDASILMAFLFDTNIPAAKCATVYGAVGWFELVGITVAEVVLFMRTYAIWGQSRRILYVLILLFLIIIPCAVVMKLDISTLDYFPSPFPRIAPCFSGGKKSILYIDYALVLGVEFVVLLLTIWIGIKQWREEVNPLTTVLYRDAITFSSILFASSIANVSVLAGTPSIALHLLLLEPQRVLHSVLTSRIILHLRIASSDAQEDADTIPPMDFDLPGSSRNVGMTTASLAGGDTQGTISMFTDTESRWHGGSVDP